MTDDRSEEQRRPARRGFGPEDDEGQIIGIGGITYCYTNGKLVEIAREPEALTRERHAMLEAEMDKADNDVSPHGNSWKTMASVELMMGRGAWRSRSRSWERYLATSG